jgi:hypothetical protein
MFTPRQRRKRYALDAYVRVELEERTASAINTPEPLLRDTSDQRKAAGEQAIAHARAC